MSDRIALQLYTVRDAAGKDFDGTVRKVAEMGYRFVETAGFPGTTPEKAAALFKQLGITVVAAHAGMPLGDAKNQILEAMEAIGKPRLVCPWASPDLMKSVDGVKKLCDQLNEANQVARANGMTFGYHNHHAEFQVVEGKTVNQWMAQYLDPSVFFELDTYWIKVAGADPVDVIKELGTRAPLLHIKDGPAAHGQPMTAVGEGVMDWQAILSASGDMAEYWIVEMDQVAGDPLEEVRKSYQYLKGIQL